jgi:iron complex outermembrane receptor protein
VTNPHETRAAHGNSPLRLAQNDPARNDRRSSANAPGAHGIAGADPIEGGQGPGEAGKESVEEIVITGTNLVSPIKSVPVNTYSSEEITKSGKTEVAQFLNQLPEVSVAPVGNAASRGLGQSVIRLRGLPDGATAVLIDGHTTGVGGVNIRAAFDLNAVPLGLIDRIDVVPVGSSAIYGSDAIGGLVNIVLKKNFDGLGATAAYTAADGFGTEQATLFGGHAFARGNVTLGVTYSNNDALYSYQRPLTADSDWRRFADRGGIDFRTSTCVPGTVSAASGTLNGVGATTAAIPATGSNNTANYVAGAGQTNLCSTFDGSNALVPPRRRWSGVGSANFDIADGMTAYATALASRADVDTTRAFFRVRNVRVPATNAFNPFDQADHVITHPAAVIDFWARRLEFLTEHLDLDADASGYVTPALSRGG